MRKRVSQSSRAAFSQHALLERMAQEVDERTLEAYLGTPQALIRRLEPKLIYRHREDVTGAV